MNVTRRTLKRSAVVHGSSVLFAQQQQPTKLNSNLDDNLQLQETITYAQAWEITRRHKRWIQNVARGHLSSCKILCNTSARDNEVVIAYLSANSPEFLMSMMACMDHNSSRSCCTKHNNNDEVVCARYLPALLNARWSAHDIALALNHEGAASTKSIIILYGNGFRSVAEKAADILNNEYDNNHFVRPLSLPVFERSEPIIDEDIQEGGREGGVVVVDSGEANVGAELDMNAPEIYSLEHIDGRSTALVLFTSGTTKGSKGVALSHNSLIVQAMTKLMGPCAYDSSSSMLASVPLFHIGGVSSALALIMAGGRLIFTPKSLSSATGLEQLRFRADLTMTYMKQGQVNTLVVVPAMLHSLLPRGNDSTDLVYPLVKMILVGGQSLSISQTKRAQTTFPNAKIIQTYACSEAGSSITFATVINPAIKPSYRREHGVNKFQYGSFVGYAPPHIELAIADEKDRKGSSFVPVRTVGQICTRGPHVMNGYWPIIRHNAENAQALMSGGWLKMGDLGYIDECGRLFFCGRASDTIRSGGETIFAPEIENILLSLQIVEECAVFPLPDDKFGEVVCAVIVPCGEFPQSGDMIIEQINQHCQRERLAKYKRPKHMFLRPELPRNSGGKVSKHVLVRDLGTSITGGRSRL